jgi:transmembrane 9 superfamily member 2/4
MNSGVRLNPRRAGALGLTFLSLAHAFYLPGVAPTDYHESDIVPLNVNRLVPRQSEADASLHRIAGYDYYHPAFHFCQPGDGVQDVGPESLGSVLFGDRIKNSPFEIRMLENTACHRLCEEAAFNTQAAQFTNTRIRESYYVNWLIDGLPAGQTFQSPETGEQFRRRGFPLGELDSNGNPRLNNHFDISIEYHDTGGGKFRVVGVQVYPSSRADAKNTGDNAAECGSENSPPVLLKEDGTTWVSWTYSVTWTESPIAWAVRWDSYLHVEDPKIHWFSLINSAVIVVFLIATVSAILMRALKKDFHRYNRLDTFNLEDFSATDFAEDSIQEDSGWKLVHGDVFRSPPSPMLLSVFLGNGAQLFFMTGLTIAFALFGFLSPSNRGSLGTAILVLYMLLSFVGGYVSARVYKTFGGDAWKRNIVLTPVMVPAVVFSTFFLLNLFMWARGSSGAVPFSTMLVLILIWFVISVPLSVAGSWIGFKQKV